MNPPKRGRPFHNWRRFKEARAYAQSLGLKNSIEWEAWTRSVARPDDIPSNPGKVYKDKGWVSLGDWLGNGHIAVSRRVFRSFKDARTFVRSLGLKNYNEWIAWVRSSECPDDIPASASRIYKDKGWAGFGDWLGNGRKHKYGWRSFKDARNYVHSIGLRSYKGWIKWCKSGSRPNDIPSHPSIIYKGKGWVSMGDWLGTGKEPNAKKGDLL